MTSVHSSKLYLLVFAGLIWALNSTGQVRVSRHNSDPKAILVKMSHRYGTFSSYEDVGIVVSTIDRATGGDIEKKPFKTFFARPRLFRFEWIDYFPWKDGRLYVIWSNGRAAFSYSQPDRYEEKESLELAIAGATGISRGAAYTIPTMLMNDRSGFTFTDLNNPKLANEEMFEGELCYHVTGRHSSGALYDLWISKRDYLLRKSRNESKYEDYTAIEEEIHRNIKINQPIAKNVFEFQPPIPLSRIEEKPPVGNDSLLSQESPNWTEFVSNEGRFSVLLPSKPTTQTLTLETGQGRVVHYGFTAVNNGLICVLVYADLPRMLARPGNEKAIFDEARDALLKEVQVSLASEKTVALEGHPGREISAHLLGGEIKARFYLVNERLYQLVITRFNIFDKSPDVIDKFFGSFKVFPGPKPTARDRVTDTITSENGESHRERSKPPLQ